MQGLHMLFFTASSGSLLDLLLSLLASGCSISANNAASCGNWKNF